MLALLDVCISTAVARERNHEISVFRRVTYLAAFHFAIPRLHDTNQTITAPGCVLFCRPGVNAYDPNNTEQTRWGRNYSDSMLFSGGMRFSDGGTVLENKFLNAVVEQQGFLAAFTGN